jgi:hypothetical protein
VRGEFLSGQASIIAMQDTLSCYVAILTYKANALPGYVESVVIAFSSGWPTIDSRPVGRVYGKRYPTYLKEYAPPRGRSLFDP